MFDEFGEPARAQDVLDPFEVAQHRREAAPSRRAFESRGVPLMAHLLPGAGEPELDEDGFEL
jgi:hypothetical protein